MKKKIFSVALGALLLMGVQFAANAHQADNSNTANSTMMQNSQGNSGMMNNNSNQKNGMQNGNMMGGN